VMVGEHAITVDALFMSANIDSRYGDQTVDFNFEAHQARKK
jgi:hypothetical protein